ncbi:hypothetical protein SCLCIDRAFT_1218733 [Scleroderma citrinum Foug A]|uniref:Uncharacterized protein n=1 Tax=Scleroderma citrinum Foug A TaxID=1036808 RepID=A0A0C3DQV2_9AGAM|nr:hypothetical protein SCLCIDRAFT_1218733 [Scleroderma citrinum Foug A]
MAIGQGTPRPHASCIHAQRRMKLNSPLQVGQNFVERCTPCSKRFAPSPLNRILQWRAPSNISPGDFILWPNQRYVGMKKSNW